MTADQSSTPKTPSLELLDYFASMENSRMTEYTVNGPKGSYSAIQASINDLVGSGRNPSRFLASVKAVAECLERKFFESYMQTHKSTLPWYKRNSNGFAVHFNSEDAIEAAKREIIERHILQLTFLKHGWDGFYLKSQVTHQDLTITELVSPYTTNGYIAGLVLTQSNRFEGVSIGYFCDSLENYQNSPRWDHATSESIDKVEPLFRLLSEGHYSPANNIDQQILFWFTNPFKMPAFNKLSHDFIQSSEVELKTEITDLKFEWKLKFPFFGVRCDSADAIPLLLSKQNRSEIDQPLREIFEKYDLPVLIPDRNPIL